jgi:hypothetical protein
LERKFPNYKFYENKGFLVCESSSHGLCEEIQSLVSTFESQVLRVGNRILPRENWSITSKDESSQRGPGLVVPLKSDVKGAFFLESTYLEVLESLDKLFEKFCISLGAQKIRVPSLISKRNLERCQYLPKQAHQVSVLVNAGDGSSTETCLTPAACLPLYGALEQRSFETSQAYTFCSSTYRFEGGIYSDSELERNWEYPIREFVVFHKHNEHQRYLEVYSDFMHAFSSRFLRSASMTSASDIFFHIESVNLALHQLLHSSKFEVSYVDRNGKNLALTSFNIHGNSFTKEYQIRFEDSGAESLCVGWGLARIVRAIIESNHFPYRELCNEITAFTCEMEAGLWKKN